MDTLTDARPAEPFADVKARAADAVEAARDEILDLSHRIHANPEPAFEEHQAARLGRRGARASRVRGGAPGGQPRDRGPRTPRRRSWAPTARGSGSSPSTTRCRASATAAATTRWPRPGSAPRSRSPRCATRCAGEVVFLGTPAEERGSGKAIMIEDGLFEGLDAALLYHPCDRNHVELAPLASEDVDRRVHGPAVARRVRPVARARTRSTR